ncbi:hypothetical protein PA10_00155 [Pseudomonas phage pPa_SNUABM_DT01]|nr:hypothetical protein PA10_00155 [Pseudomonas phage pPa_SNUABM_DT01]
MSEQNQRPETILDDPSLALKAKRQDGMEGDPTLRPAYYENNPRLVVKTKVPNDKNNGKIEAALSNRAFYSVLRALEMVAESSSPIVVFLDNKGHRFVDKKRDPNPSIMSCIKLEKNNEGVISICISAGKNRPLIEFPFLDCTYHQFRDGNGSMPVSTASKLYCLGWIDVMREYLPAVIEKHYAKPAWMARREQGGGGNNNWGNRGGNSGGGGNWNNGGNRGGQQSGGGGGWGGGGGQQQSASVSGGSDFNFDDDVPL